MRCFRASQPQAPEIVLERGEREHAQALGVTWTMSPRRSSTLGISYGDMPCGSDAPLVVLGRKEERERERCGTNLEVSHDAADDRAVADEEDVGRLALKLEDDRFEAARSSALRVSQGFS